MFKFFRQIRHGLINENKTSKYFRYALGEIILVVVGILIALQINNWNERRTDRNLERQYVNRLIQDLVMDSETMSAAVAIGEKKLLNLEAVMKALREPDSVRESPGIAVPNMSYSYSRPELQTTTFKELMSSGNLRLIQEEELRFELGNHYLEVEHEFDRLHERRTRLAWVAKELFPSTFGGIGKIDAAFFADPHVEERLDRLLSPEYQGLVYHEKAYGDQIVRISGGILRLTEEMLEKLRVYQDLL